jgi:hypothetical protein
MLAASVNIVYISQLEHVHAILGHVPSAETLWKELRSPNYSVTDHRELKVLDDLLSLS